MLFSSFNNANLLFGIRKLTQRLYTTSKNLLITNIIELIRKYKFVEKVLDQNIKTFVIYIKASQASLLIPIHPSVIP